MIPGVTMPWSMMPALVLAVAAAGIGSAGATPSTGQPWVVAEETPAAAVEQADPAAVDAKPRPPTWQIAAGLFVNVGPTYGGSATQKASLQLGYYVRRGRWSLTNRSDLVTSQGEEVLPGLAADLLEPSKVRLAASLASTTAAEQVPTRRWSRKATCPRRCACGCWRKAACQGPGKAASRCRATSSITEAAIR